MAQALIIDIETIGEKWEDIDPLSQENLSSWIKKESKNETELEFGMDALREGLGFSPLTGRIVAVGMMDYATSKRAVYYQNPDAKEKEKVEDGVKYVAYTEAEMLNHFWEAVAKYQTVVTFNGYAFDVPYLVVRSAVHGIRPTANLMINRYLSSQYKATVQHVDLQDQLSFYGAMRKKGSLHMWTRAFGIKSPKTAEVNGHAVSAMYDEGRYLDIARYNAADLVATGELYTKWTQFMKF